MTKQPRPSKPKRRIRPNWTLHPNVVEAVESAAWDRDLSDSRFVEAVLATELGIDLEDVK